MKTWQHLRQAALYDPFLQKCIALSENQWSDREAVLISTVLAMADERKRLLGQILRALERCSSATEQQRILGLPEEVDLEGLPRMID